MSKKGKPAIREAIENAVPIPPPSLVPDHLTARYKMLETGLHRTADDALPWISAPFKIEAETIDEAGRWGVLMSWQDRNGQKREEIFPRELFSGECGELRSRLASGGLTMMSDQKSRQAFAEYLNLASSPARARCVSRTGWHRIGAARVFVLPSEIIGKAAERVILETTTKERAPFNRSGTLAEWRGAVAQFAVKNSRLVFAISLAFAGPLLDLTGDDGGGFNLKGKSRAGKTTALRVAASVWGGEPGGSGAAAYIRAWRATGNALEGIASVHSDTLLCLDEMGQVDAKELGEISYMLANGQGKTRSDRSGAIRGQSRFRVLFLSTGEVGLADKNAEGKKATKAGQEVRFVDVEADAGAGLGIFDYLHDEAGADVFAELLRTGTRQTFGTAGPAFIEHILSAAGRDPEFVPGLNDRIDTMIAGWLKPSPDANGQVRSVAKRFGLVAVAGELASQANITGWPAGEAEAACHRIFKHWLAQRGTTGAKEDAQAVMQLRDFINRHAESRFTEWKKAEVTNADGQTEEAAPHERFRTVNRAGWKRWTVDGLGRGFWAYYLTREGMTEALAGLDFRASVLVLADQGLLVKDGAGKSTVSRRPPGVEDNIRLYEVKSAILGAGDDEGEARPAV
jgi:uncharacterized protein (DUF927 family)